MVKRMMNNSKKRLPIVRRRCLRNAFQGDLDLLVTYFFIWASDCFFVKREKGGKAVNK